MLKTIQFLLTALTLLFICNTLGICADTPKNGFAVLYPILRTYESQPELEKEYCEKLGINYPIKTTRKPLMAFREYDSKHFSGSNPENEQESYQRLAQWYKEYEYVFDVVREALACPEFQIVKQPASQKPLNLNEMFFSSGDSKGNLFEDLYKLRDFLIARATVLTEEKKYDEAFDTLMLMNRLGTVVKNQVYGDGDMRPRLVGSTIKASTWRFHSDLFRADSLSAAWYRGRIKTLSNNAENSVFSGMSLEMLKALYFQSLEEGRNNPHTKDNLFFFERLKRRMSKDTEGLIPADEPDEREKTVDEWFPKVDWDELKQLFVPWLEQAAEAEKLPTYIERCNAYKKIESDKEAFAGKYTSPKNSTPTELAASVIFPQLLSSQAGWNEIFTRTEIFEKIQPIQYAIAAYHAEHKKWPESLADVICEELPELPNDPFSAGKPFGYRKFDGGCVVYSVGENGTLDGDGEKFQFCMGLPPNTSFWRPDVDDIGFFQTDADFSADPQ